MKRSFGELLKDRNVRAGILVAGIVTGLGALSVQNAVDPKPIVYTPEKQAESLKGFVHDMDGYRRGHIAVTAGSIIGNSVTMTVTEGKNPDDPACHEDYIVKSDPHKLLVTFKNDVEMKDAFAAIDEIESDLNC